MIEELYKPHLLKVERNSAQKSVNSVTSWYLNRNERVLPFDESVLAGVIGQAISSDFHLYPDLERFYMKLSSWLNISKQSIFITEGVSGAIKILIEAFCNPGDNVTIVRPSFALYEVYPKLYEVNTKVVTYNHKMRIDLEEIKSSIDHNTKIIFLPNPNVPIESINTLDQLEDLAIFCQKNRCLLVLDEVYYHFNSITAIPLIDKYENCLILRSFSKAFGLAGVRVGYVLGQEKNIKYISKLRGGYETNRLSEAVVCYFLDNYKVIEDYIDAVKSGFVVLKRYLESKKIKYYGGEYSNFIFIVVEDMVLLERLVTTLECRGFIVRANWLAPCDKGFSITGAPVSIIKQFISNFDYIIGNKKIDGGLYSDKETL